MKNKDNFNSEDKQLRRLLEDTKIEANKNLKFRVMQQIETESILAKSRTQTSISSMKSTIVLLAITIVILLFGASSVYLGFDMKGVASKELFFNYIIPICSILSFLALIFALDAKIRYKRTQKHLHPNN